MIITEQDMQHIVDMAEVCFSEGLLPDVRDLLARIAAEKPGIVAQFLYDAVKL